MKKILVTVADDRMGRKNGKYEATQKKIGDLFHSRCTPKEMFFDLAHHANFEDITQTTFYQNNKALLDNVDPARNGRVYKPFAISEALNRIDYGDLLVYTDCSPEMWAGCGTSWFGGTCDLNNLYKLCESNDNILTHFVRWDTRDMAGDDLGIHTHMNFTTDLCMNAMDIPDVLRNSYQHASGMIVMIKTKVTEQFVEEWLYWNCDDRCACLGRADVPGDYSYWSDWEDQRKMGHRHDQSISGLLMSKYDRSLVWLKDYVIHNPYNFVNLCFPKSEYIAYDFVRSNTPSNHAHRINRGDVVINQQGHLLTVFDVMNKFGEEVYIVGFHRQSAYKATIENIRRL